MTHTVFFSWQADTPSSSGRNFIEKAATAAIKQLAQDLEVDEAIRDGLEVDRDTRGVAGTPPIVDTIFFKIDAAAAFLADLTFVGKRLDGIRPTPNPNVLLEYGWALKSRGYPRIICVMNTHYGVPDDNTLPFNMKHLRRPIQYALSPDADDATRRKVLADLTATLKDALKAIVESEDFRQSIPTPPEPPKFEPAPELDGPARFRKRGADLGLMELGLQRFLGQEGQPVMLAEGPALWLRVMPDRRLDKQWSISTLREVMSKPGMIVVPLASHPGWAHVRGADGFGHVPHPPTDNRLVSSVSFAFKTGEVWTTYAGPFATPDGNTFLNVEADFVECFLCILRFMGQGLGISLPYRWIAGIDGINGKRMQRFAPPGQGYTTPYTARSMADMVSETGVLKEGDDPHLALVPFFQAIYDVCGEPRGEYMNAALMRFQV